MQQQRGAAAEPFADAAAIARKAIIYVGGLDEAVDESTLTAAFRPFGDLQQVILPRDGVSQKHRGFAYVEFQDPDDAAAALENMHDSEMFGRVLKCNLAAKTGKGGAVWAGEAGEEFYQSMDKSAADVDAAIQNQQAQEAKARATR